MIKHQFAPIYNNESRILILGSFPSVASRKNDFYYGHRQNRFWRLITEILREVEVNSIEEKTEMLLRNHIALYDALCAAEVVGSLDSGIKAYIPSDLNPILKEAKIDRIYCNGKKAYDVVTRDMGFKALLLPSTSPANAVYSYEKLLVAWSVILDSLCESS